MKKRVHDYAKKILSHYESVLFQKEFDCKDSKKSKFYKELQNFIFENFSEIVKEIYAEVFRKYEYISKFKPEILKEIGTYDQEDEYSICFNGALIVENKNSKILNFKGLSFDVAKMLFDKARDYDVCVLVFTVDMCYIYNADPDEVQRKKDQKAPFVVVEDYNINNLKNDRIAKILYQKK